jgi:hypothetical protein
MKTIRKWLARRRLEKLMKPNPELRWRRLAQMRGERKVRYLRNISDIAAELRGQP